MSLKRLKKDFDGVRKIWRRYWSAYGGSAALFCSTYFYAALVLTILNFGAWFHSGWWDIVIGSVPTILGFTLAGLAMLLGMDTNFSKFIAQDDSGEGDAIEDARNGVASNSPFMALVSAFVHFILTQCVALLFALTVKSMSFYLDGMPAAYYQIVVIMNRVVWFLGYFIYLYSMVLIFSSAFAIFRATTWYELYIRNSTKKTDP